MGSNWKSNSVTLYPHMLNWINGELLGDGCLNRPPLMQSARFNYSSKYMEYTWYVSRTLQSFGIVQSGEIHKYLHKIHNSYSFVYISRSYIELRMLYDIWYPWGKKAIPEGLLLPSVTCRQWYIGDGCLQHRQERRPFITLCTECFSVTDVDWLVSRLVALGFDTTRQSKSNRIRISSYSTEDFLNYIGECPVECYKYKWDLGGK